MDQHDFPLRCGLFPWDGSILRLAVFLRKAIVAMVSIDVVDGGFFGVLEGLIAGKPAPTMFFGETQMLKRR
ncbi:hypothetical protein [Pseudomonas sp. UMAB-40]|uniref:hypothetical protein n=1 Tax=Pseudomonas sp. UMAB-40 TaxID=1365407 RepID=UPI001C55CA40|nr:hypothetical protein [Pseudomonas sp. UMAB-40]